MDCGGSYHRNVTTTQAALVMGTAQAKGQFSLYGNEGKNIYIYILDIERKIIQFILIKQTRLAIMRSFHKACLVIL